MRPTLAAAASLIAALAPAQTPAHGHDGPTFLPLAVGASWRYRVLESGREDPHMLRMQVVQRDESPGGAEYRVQVTHGASEGLRTLRVDRDGIEELRSVGRRRAGGSPGWVLRLLACPPGPILTWTSPPPAGSADERAGATANGRVISFDDEVDVPAGTFRAVTVEIELERGGMVHQRTRTSYARSVGIVRETTELFWANGNHHVRTIELLRARPGPADGLGIPVRLAPRVDADAIASPELDAWPQLSLVRNRAGTGNPLLRETRRGLLPFAPDSEEEWNRYLSEARIRCTHGDRVLAEDLVTAIAAAQVAATMTPRGARLLPLAPVLSVPTGDSELTAEGSFEIRNDEGVALRRIRVLLRIEGEAIAHIRVRDR